MPPERSKKMLKAVRSFRTEDGEWIEAERCRVAEDHELVEAYPDCWALALDGPGEGLRSIYRSTFPNEGVMRSTTDQFGSEADRVRAVEAAEQRVAALRTQAQNPHAREAGYNVGPASSRRRDTSRGYEQREAALRAIEDHDELSAEAADRLDDWVRADKVGTDAEYLAAVGDPNYLTSFMRRITNPDAAPFETSPAETAAAQRVQRAMAERALSVGTDTAGGFAIPFTLDPSVQLTSSGQTNPLRALATVRPIVTSEWRGISSAGVTASWDPEATEVSDDSPAFSQPVAKAEKAAAFVPFSIEIGQDWASLQTELATLVGDAKDNLESVAFISGGGSAVNQPQGLHVGGTNSVSVGAGTIVGGLYTVSGTVGPRYSPNASWISSRPVMNTVFRQVAEASTTEPKFIPETRDQILGQKWTEVSAMTAGTASGGTIVCYGDYRQAYTIVDRVGMSVEIIAHLFGTVANRPTGQRGLYAYWRTGAIVTNPNAVWSLKIA
jgi:HK97 family phage major capsid protein